LRPRPWLRGSQHSTQAQRCGAGLGICRLSNWQRLCSCRRVKLDGVCCCKSASSATGDAAKIREIREVVGSGYGDGFLLQCLLHYGGSVPAVVGAVLDGSLPPQLAALPIAMKIGEDPGDGCGPQAPSLQRGLSSDDKKRVMAGAERMQRTQAAIDAAELAEYNDDYDDTLVTRGKMTNQKGPANDSDLDRNSDEEGAESGSGDEDSRWKGQNRGKGGKIKGGKGKGKGKEPVQGQTIEARRKEANKSSVANHNRKDGQAAKLRKGMF